MSYNDDSQEIIDRLTGDLEGICSKYWPGWTTATRKGVQVGLMTPRVKKSSKLPTSSFTVTLSGAKRGNWYRFSESVGGHSLALLHYGETGRVPSSKEDWRECYRLAREYLGMERQREIDPAEKEARERRRRQEQEERERRRAEEAAKAAEYREERILSAAEIWKQTKPLAGSLGDVYLRSRGLPPVSEWPWDCTRTIRFHPSLVSELEPKGGAWPALVGRVADSFDTGVSLWQVLVSRDGKGKASLNNCKVGRGPAGGGAVRIGGDGPSIGVAEGMETALAAWFLNGCRKPVWACLSTSGMIGFEPPMFVERIEIFPDGDGAKMNERGVMSSRPGMAAAVSLRDRVLPILGAGNVSIAPEPTIGSDYLDVYCDMKRKGLL